MDEELLEPFNDRFCKVDFSRQKGGGFKLTVTKRVPGGRSSKYGKPGRMHDRNRTTSKYVLVTPKGEAYTGSANRDEEKVGMVDDNTEALRQGGLVYEELMSF